MKNYTTYRRQNIRQGAPKWGVKDPNGACIAMTETSDEAQNLAQQLSELQRLRVLLAVSAKQLATSQACAILGCTPEQLVNQINTCLAKGYPV